MESAQTAVFYAAHKSVCYDLKKNKGLLLNWTCVKSSQKTFSLTLSFCFIMILIEKAKKWLYS